MTHCVSKILKIVNRKSFKYYSCYFLSSLLSIPPNLTCNFHASFIAFPNSENSKFNKNLSTLKIINRKSVCQIFCTLLSIANSYLWTYPTLQKPITHACTWVSSQTLVKINRWDMVVAKHTPISSPSSVQSKFSYLWDFSSKVFLI